MDSLKIISDINTHLSELDDKITKTSKSTAVAFSYLYSRINDIDTNNDRMDKIDVKLSYITNDVNTTRISTYSYYTVLKDNISSVSNNVYSLSIKNDETITGIGDRISKLENEVDKINKKLEKIIEAPERYIVIKKEQPFYIKIFNKAKDTLYKMFHLKQIKQERERIAELEKQRIEEAKRKAEEAEKQRLLKEQQEREEKRNKIKTLLK